MLVIIIMQTDSANWNMMSSVSKLQTRSWVKRSDCVRKQKKYKLFFSLQKINANKSTSRKDASCSFREYSVGEDGKVIMCYNVRDNKGDIP